MPSCTVHYLRLYIAANQQVLLTPLIRIGFVAYSPQQVSVWTQTGTSCLVYLFCHIHAIPWTYLAKLDTSPFIYHQGTTTTYLLLYVDVFLTASSLEFLQQIISSLQTEFPIKDLGPLHHFICITVERRGKWAIL
jgi:hypothetical protein